MGYRVSLQAALMKLVELGRFLLTVPPAMPVVRFCKSKKKKSKS